MAAPVPVVFNEALNLTTVGAAAETIKFGSCSMESDKFITVRKQSSLPRTDYPIVHARMYTAN